VNHAIEALKSAGESTRFRALRAMIDAGVELCACEIIDVLLKPQYTISKSLGNLVSAGLVKERREGRMMMYGLAHSALNDGVFAAIEAVPLEGDEQMKADHDRLLSRLAARVGGACVSGC
jgi:ArsR family transcriptional regulator, arsenate/arsenite/antimonite-responsive transcriptional repressor